jgi:hypothetical protein
VPVAKQDRNFLRDVEDDTAILFTGIVTVKATLSFSKLLPGYFSIPSSQCYSERCSSGAGMSLSLMRSRPTSTHIDEV